MKTKMKLVIVTLTTMITAIAYSKIAVASSCAIIGESIYCW